MRCFIAVDIPEDLKKRIEKVQQKFSIGGIKLIESRNFHFTLKFLGEVGDNKIEKIKEMLCKIRAEPFETTLKGVGAFPNEKNPRIIFVGCESPEMEALARDVDQKMAELGFPSEERYRNHLTIARVKTRPEKDMAPVLSSLKNAEFGRAIVSEIKLKHSVLSPKGPEYSDIAMLILKKGPL